ncbi:MULTISPECIES: HD domain-containing protein [Bacillus]|uniref:HD domain-containing protein n=1 Tax=Bacillus TaxID=1386 RepID=UPI000D8C7B48|nr:MULTISPECIES: HD domain-containing protein [Bacillus]MDA1656353.1 HD domain-containing protein [Bacillus cereus group sp. TH150LC]PYE91519.1 hypothetical protein ATL10_101757 [Bacillus sp. 196mf]
MKYVDEIHGEIFIDDEYALEIIETKVFHRLKNLKQQGNTHFVLPGTIHNRFSHSLGVYHVMKLMLQNLEQQGYNIEDYEKRLALLSALLHDIGHGPFSHCFENITGLNHEIWSGRIIQEHTEMKKVFLKNPRIQKDIISVISKDNKFPVIQGLLFSNLGADKLDYFSRDLFYSGLIQLENININKIIKGSKIQQDKVIISPTIINEIEKLFVIKKNLFNTGFASEFVIGKDVLLKMIFKQASNLFKINQLKHIPNYLIPILSNSKSMWSVEQYTELTDSYILESIIHWRDEEYDDQLKRLCNKYLSKEDNLFWDTLDTNNSYQINNDYTEVIQQDPKYGLYTGGIFLRENSVLFDLAEKSNLIKDLSKKENLKSLVYNL